MLLVELLYKIHDLPLGCCLAHFQGWGKVARDVGPRDEFEVLMHCFFAVAVVAILCNEAAVWESSRQRQVGHLNAVGFLQTIHYTFGYGKAAQIGMGLLALVYGKSIVALAGHDEIPPTLGQWV